MVRLKNSTSRTICILLSWLLLASNYEGFVTASGNMADFSESTTLSPEYVARFYTENQIDGQHDNPQKCDQQVLNFRQKYNQSTLTLGVKPTVGLGAALVIFLMVGAFAAGIAQAFQMVSNSFIYFNHSDYFFSGYKIINQ